MVAGILKMEEGRWIAGHKADKEAVFAEAVECR